MVTLSLWLRKTQKRWLKETPPELMLQAADIIIFKDKVLN